jgi:pimeloyl-ACP methyl ester carboxylesterase
MRRRLVASVVLVCLLVGQQTAVQAAPPGPVLEQGVINGAAFKIEIPANWNGTLALYSHGYVTPGGNNPATDVGDPLTGAFLKANGYALAGSAYRTTGWSVHEALEDQIALLDYFQTKYGTPQRTIAWGHSLGGMITAGLLERHPERFAGALPMCGVVAGGVGVWNTGLDAGFVLKTLLASTSSLQLVHITNPGANLAQALALLNAAKATPQGRARLALSAAVGDLPGWFSPASPEPLFGAFQTRLDNQVLWNQTVDFPFGFALRSELELRAGGNPSWNTDTNYRQLFERSIDRGEVIGLYAEAGMHVDDDLRTLARAPRIAADPGAVQYLTQNIVFTGDIQRDVLTLHTVGDGLVLVQDEQAYARAVRRSGQAELLRETFIHRAGHCTFTPAETITAFNSLVHRLDTGKWTRLDPADLNAAAAQLGLSLNVLFAQGAVVPTPPAYLQFKPSAFPRPFDLSSSSEQDDDDE